MPSGSYSLSDIVGGGGSDNGHISVNVSVPVGGGFVTVTVPYLNSLPDVSVVAYRTKPLYPDYNSNRDYTNYTYHDMNTAPTPFPGINFVTNTDLGNGPIHVKIKNGDNGQIIKHSKSGPFTYEYSFTGNVQLSLSYSIGNNYISISADGNVISFGFGYQKDNNSFGLNTELPDLLLVPLLLNKIQEIPVQAPRPTFVPVRPQHIYNY